MDICVQEVDPNTDKTLAKYVIKGADRHYVDYFHLRSFAEDQGVVEGRRTCVSPSIGRTARKNAGFVPKLHRDAWKKAYVAPARKPKRQVFVNDSDDGALSAQKKVRRSLWGGLELPTVEKPTQPARAPLSGAGVVAQQAR